MKNIFTLISFLVFTTFAEAQVCNVVVNATAHRITSDTTLTYDNSPVMQSWVPCPGKLIQLDSAITQIDTFYLREGNTLNIDSLSTLAGGFVIYADSGSIVDCNFKQTLLIYYTPNTILKDTIGWGNKVLCSDIVFDFSNMIEAHDCNGALSIIDHQSMFTHVATLSAQWNIFLAQRIQGRALLFDLNARQISAMDIDGRELQVKRDELIPGIYFLLLQTNQGRYSIKLMNE